MATKNNKLPRFELVIDEALENETGVEFISLVDEPAIEVKGFAFDKNKTIETKFSIIEDKQIIVGPAMIPNKIIYRREGGLEYEVYFSADTICKIRNKFNKLNRNGAINLDHSSTILNAFVQESWIIESNEYDKSKMYGFDLPIGTWFVTVKIEDKEVWQKQVKELGKFSFSVEGLLKYMEVKNSKHNKQQENLLLDSMYQEIAEEIIMKQAKKK